jgi:hypothetical protein
MITKEQALEAKFHLARACDHAIVAHYEDKQSLIDYHLAQVEKSFLLAAELLGLELVSKPTVSTGET